MLGEHVYNVVGTMASSHCFGRGGIRLLQSRFASKGGLTGHQNHQEYPFHQFLHKAALEECIPCDLAKRRLDTF
jgi:hypothetical protein